MKITEEFIKTILKSRFKNFQYIYDNSLLLQYLDKKMKAIHGIRDDTLFTGRIPVEAVR